MNKWFRNEKGFSLAEALIAVAIIAIVLVTTTSGMSWISRIRTKSNQAEKVKQFFDARLSILESAKGCTGFLTAMNYTKLPLGSSKTLSEVRIAGNTLFTANTPELNNELLIEEINLSEVTGADPKKPNDPIPPDRDLRWQPGSGKERAYLRLDLNFKVYAPGTQSAGAPALFAGTRSTTMKLVISPGSGNILSCVDLPLETMRVVAREACNRAGFYWDERFFFDPRCRWEAPLSAPEGSQLPNSYVRKLACKQMRYDLNEENYERNCKAPQ